MRADIRKAAHAAWNKSYADGNYGLDAVDAAIAAVAPAIEAAALERAAVACSELEVHSTSSRNPGIKRKIKVGPAVAAIIRALKETT